MAHTLTRTTLGLWLLRSAADLPSSRTFAFRFTTSFF
jgi:hypothetical protein